MHEARPTASLPIYILCHVHKSTRWSYITLPEHLYHVVAYMWKLALQDSLKRTFNASCSPPMTEFLAIGNILVSNRLQDNG